MSSPIIQNLAGSNKFNFLFNDANTNDSTPTPELLEGNVLVDLYRINPTISIAVIVITAYLLLVRHLRFKRVHGLQERYGYTYEQFKNLNYKDAQTISGTLLLLESPWMFLTGKDFAFLRVCSLHKLRGVTVADKYQRARHSQSQGSHISLLAPKRW